MTPIPDVELAAILANLGAPSLQDSAVSALAALQPEPVCRMCLGPLKVRDVDLGVHTGCAPAGDPGPEPPPTADELAAALVDFEAGSARSRQVAMGPSEIGTPCIRKLGYALRNATKRPGDGTVKWASMVGTAVHRMNAEALALANEKAGRQRWLIEQRVTAETGLSGNTDAYDTDHDIVCDWKGLALDTPIPTPAGWASIGSIQPGDRVYGPDGNTYSVVAKSPVFERPCYRVTFDDGATIVSDNVHEWPMLVGAKCEPMTLSTEDAKEQLFSSERRPQRHLRIATTAPLRMRSALLPIAPYVLGCWIGDGNSNGGAISKPDVELFEHIAREGYEVSPEHKSSHGTRTIYGLTTSLRRAGLIGHKEIPAAYLRGSVAQRLGLIQGLMDTDGTWNRLRRQAVFTTVRKSLAYQVAELIHTMGWKAKVFEVTKHGFGLTVTAYDVAFTPHDLNPFRLSRKAGLVRIVGSTKAHRRIVRSIESVPTVPTQCIEVDNPDHTFLCGEQMIATHNCVAKSTIEKAQRHGPGQTYTWQAHVYGRGWQRLGYDPKWVRVIFLPRYSSKFSDGFEWTAPYSREIADQAMDRMAEVAARLDALDVDNHPERWAQLEEPPSSSDCFFCNHRRASIAPADATGCPGVRSKADLGVADYLDSLPGATA